MSRINLVVGAIFALAVATVAARAADDPAQAQIRAALTQWMADFNAGRAEKVCDLFASDLRADVRGQPERDYAAVCALLRRSLADRARRFAYALDIREIQVWGEVAMVRLVWTLTIQQGSAKTVSVESGMDVLRRQPDGSWKIARFLAYAR